jgi:hypothetical protein
MAPIAILPVALPRFCSLSQESRRAAPPDLELEKDVKVLELPLPVIDMLAVSR